MTDNKVTENVMYCRYESTEKQKERKQLYAVSENYNWSSEEVDAYSEHVKKGNISELKKMLEQKKYIGENAFSLAIKHNQDACFYWLHKNGIRWNQNAVIDAIICNKPQILQYLLENGCRKYITENTSYAILHNDMFYHNLPYMHTMLTYLKEQGFPLSEEVKKYFKIIGESIPSHEKVMKNVDKISENMALTWISIDICYKSDKCKFLSMTELKELIQSLKN